MRRGTRTIRTNSSPGWKGALSHPFLILQNENAFCAPAFENRRGFVRVNYSRSSRPPSLHFVHIHVSCVRNEL